MENTKKWLENFWYHYKWMAIIIVFFTMALCVCLVQCNARDEYDMYALYAGPLYIGGEQSSQLRDAINDYMDKDRQNVCINSFVYVSEEKKTEYEQGDAYINQGINMQQASDFFDFLYTASFNFIIIDSELYSSIRKSDILTPISEITDNINNTYDEYSIKLYDTSLPNKYAIFKNMPEDTLLCFRKNVLMQNLANKNSKANYEYQINIFKKIIEQ